MCQEPLYPLTLVTARAIGLMTMVDSGKHDHKYLAVAINDPEFNSFREAAELPPHRLMMLRRFFQDYKLLEGKSVEVDEIEPAAKRCRSSRIRSSDTARTGDGGFTEMMPCIHVEQSQEVLCTTVVKLVLGSRCLSQAKTNCDIGPLSFLKREIRCQFVFSGKNDELTPDFPPKWLDIKQ